MRDYLANISLTAKSCIKTFVTFFPQATSKETAKSLKQKGSLIEDSKRKITCIIPGLDQPWSTFSHFDRIADITEKEDVRN
ncbi:hypothetical protein GCM10022209_52660 [Chitinophaga oryziterrae]